MTVPPGAAFITPSASLPGANDVSDDAYNVGEGQTTTMFLSLSE